MGDAFDRIPKVELHGHVEGTVRPGTVVELAREAGRALPVDDPAELYRYDSLDSDDPAMEGLDLGLDYQRVAKAYGLEVEEMRRIALEGIDSTWLDDSERRELRREFEAVPA